MTVASGNVIGAFRIERIVTASGQTRYSSANINSL